MASGQGNRILGSSAPYLTFGFQSNPVTSRDFGVVVVIYHAPTALYSVRVYADGSATELTAQK